MIGTDDDGGLDGDDCTGAEAFAECSDMRGKLYLSLDYYSRTFLQGFYTMMRVPYKAVLISYAQREVENGQQNNNNRAEEYIEKQRE
jgi:hypothetical protein